MILKLSLLIIGLVIITLKRGVYISQDPIGLAGGNPNVYAYVEDSNWWLDIFGLACSSAQMANNRKKGKNAAKSMRNNNVVLIEGNIPTSLIQRCN